MINLPEKHLLGVEFFRFSDLKPLSADGYFKCISLLRPLLRSSSFRVSTPGFYINRITNLEDDKGDSLRLTYYTTNVSGTLKSMDDFVKNSSNGILIFSTKSSSRPDLNKEMDSVGGDELRFRNFLNRNTQICLDVLENFGEHSLQELVTTYRHIYLPQRFPPETIFGPAFDKHSNYFQELKKVSLDHQYWIDLVSLHRGSDFGLHFMVNMIAVPETDYHPWFVRDGWILR